MNTQTTASRGPTVTDQSLMADLYRKQSRTLLQYIREAFPWAHGKSESVRSQVLGAALGEADVLAQIASALQKQRMTVPNPGAFPSSYLSFNFVSIASLLPKLAAEQRGAIDSLDRTAAAIQDSELRRLTAALAEKKRASATLFESLQTTP